MIEPIDKFILAGDWHCVWPQADRVLDFAYRRGIKVIVHVGDFGIWQTDKSYLDNIQSWLEKHDQYLYFVDGNHENFPRLYDKPLNEDGTRRVRDRISHLPRGFRWEWGGLSFLALGGAASIDKEYRTEGKSWWSEEYITDEDVAIAQAGGKADVMITHDSPAGAPNSIVDDTYGQANAIRYYGRDVLDYCTQNREQLKKVTDVVTPKILVHGHYHMSMEGTYVHGDEDGTVGYIRGLNQGSGYIADHTLIFNFNQVKEQISLLNILTKE